MANSVSVSSERLASRSRMTWVDWYVVILAALLMSATLPGRTHGLGLITKRLLEDLSVDPVTFAQINLWATLIGACFCLPCGWLIDRYGIRWVALATVLPLSAAVYMLSRAELVSDVAVWVTLTRGLGQSMLSVISITLIGKRLAGSVSVPMGVYAVVFSCLMAVATGLLGAYIIDVGWRQAWATQSWLWLLVLVPSLWWLPAEKNHVLPTSSVRSDDGNHGATLQQAVSTPCFWVFAFSISFFGLISSGLSLFSQYVLAERGFPEVVYHHTLVIGLLSGLIANMVVGWLANRVALAPLLAGSMFLLAASLGGFPWIVQLWQVYVYATVLGLAGGTLTVLFFSVWKHAFGMRHLGAIQGAAQMLTVFASAIGPLLVALSERQSGSYTIVFTSAATIAAVGGVAAIFTAVPQAAKGHWLPSPAAP
jgi:MFS family permease